MILIRYFLNGTKTEEKGSIVQESDVVFDSLTFL